MDVLSRVKDKMAGSQDVQNNMPMQKAELAYMSSNEVIRFHQTLNLFILMQYLRSLRSNCILASLALLRS